MKRFRIGLAATIIAIGGAAAPALASDQRIADFKRDKITLYDRDGNKVSTLDDTPELRAALIGLAVKMDPANGMFRIRNEGQTFYLKSRHIKVEGGPGVSGAELCSKLRVAGFRNGSSGSGASCQ